MQIFCKACNKIKISEIDWSAMLHSICVTLGVRNEKKESLECGRMHNWALKIQKLLGPTLVERHTCWLAGTSVGWEAHLLVGRHIFGWEEHLLVNRHICWLGDIFIGCEAHLLVGQHIFWWVAHLLVGDKSVGCVMVHILAVARNQPFANVRDFEGLLTSD